MMAFLRKPLLSLGTLSLLVSLAWAQGRGFGFGLGGGPGFLIAPNVQKDLKLSEEQVGKVQDALRQSYEKHRDEFQGLRDLSAEERTTKMAALGKTINDEVKKALSLSDEQSKRFDQIALQARGIQAFADPAVAAKLKLTDDQKVRIRELSLSSPLAGGFNNDASKEEREAARKKMADMRRENLAKVQAMLTDEQKKTWRELTGVLLEFEWPPRRP